MFVEKLRFLGLPGNRKVQQGKGWKGVSWAGNWRGDSVLNVTHRVHRKGPVRIQIVEMRVGMKGKEWKSQRNCYEEKASDGKTIPSVCACGCVGEARWLRTWTPGQRSWVQIAVWESLAM